jgi:hypothetical protein
VLAGLECRLDHGKVQGVREGDVDDADGRVGQELLEPRVGGRAELVRSLRSHVVSRVADGDDLGDVPRGQVSVLMAAADMAQADQADSDRALAHSASTVVEYARSFVHRLHKCSDGDATTPGGAVRTR